MNHWIKKLCIVCVIASMVPSVMFAQSNVDAQLFQSQQEEAAFAAEIAQLQQDIEIKQAIAENKTTVVYIATKPVIDKAMQDNKTMLSRLLDQDGLNVVVVTDTEKKDSNGKTIFNYGSAYCNRVQCYDGTTGVLPPAPQFKGPVKRIPNGAVVLEFKEENNGKFNERQILPENFNTWLTI